MTMTAVLDDIRPAVAAPAASRAAALPVAALPENLPELLDLGRFAEYHLAKAKAAAANNDLQGAYYQIRASLAHARLPEAVALKPELKQRLKVARSAGRA